MNLQQFWSKWRVFLIGLISAAAIAVNEVYEHPNDISTKSLILAGVIAALGFIGREWRGKGVTSLGFIGIAAGTIAQQMATGQHLSWGQMITSILVTYLAAAGAPPKPASYEKDPTIVEAKTSSSGGTT